MSGSNGTLKQADVFNRENENHHFKTRGPHWFQLSNSPILNATLLPEQLFHPMLFTNATPSPMTGPTQLQLQQYFSTHYLNAPGATFLIDVNNTSTAAKTITFPGGVTPSSIVIPPQTYFQFGLSENPDNLTFTLYQPITNATEVTNPFAGLGNGLIVKQGANYAVVSIVSGNAFVVVTNGDGQAGNPSIGFDAGTTSLLTFNETGATGFMIKTGLGTYQTITLAAGTGITITDPDGTAASPTTTTFSFNGNTAVVSPAVLGATNVQAALEALAAASAPVSGITGTGVVVWNGTAFITTSVTAGTGITVSNGSGVAGAPTISFNGATANVSPTVLGQSNVQAALTALATASAPVSTLVGTGYVVQTATNTFVLQSIAGGAGITVTNGSGVGGTSIAVNAATLPVTSVFGGQTTLQGALNALNSEIWDITAAGAGILVQTAPGVYTTRTLVAGMNISVTNGSGVGAAPTIAFTPAGQLAGLWHGFYGPGQISSTLATAGQAQSLLQWNGTAWADSITFAAATTAACVQNLKVANCIQAGLGQNWSVTGPVYSTFVGGWGFASVNPLTGPVGFNLMETNASAFDFQSKQAVVLQLSEIQSGLAGFTTGFERYISCVTEAFGTTVAGNWNLNEVFAVDVQGNIYNAGTLFYVTAPTPVSTLASKQDASIQNLDTYITGQSAGLTALQMVSTIQPIAFAYKFDPTYATGNVERLGFLADTLAALPAPYNQFAQYSGGVLVGIDITGLSVLLFQAVKESQTLISTLQTQVAALQTAVTALQTPAPQLQQATVKAPVVALKK